MRLTRNDVANIRRNCSKEEAREILRGQFALPENIAVFGWFCFGDLINQTTPGFHEEIWAMCCQPGFKGFAAPRGFAKSATVNQVYAGWLIANRRKNFIIIVSDTFTQAKEQVEALSNLIENSANFRWLYGDLKTRRWSGSDFVTSTGIRVVAKGQGQKLRGLRYRNNRPDLIIFDDLENEEVVENPERRRRLKRWVLNSAIPALTPEGEVIFIGTILHHDSLLSNIVKRENEFSAYTTKLYKALNTDETTGVKTSLWPERFTVDHLTRIGTDPEYKGYIGSIAFAQEYQNEPFSEEDAIIKPHWIGWVDERPVFKKSTIVSVDPAISQKETADYTGKIAVDRTPEDDLVIFQIGNDRMDFPANIADIQSWNDKIKPSLFLIEEVAFQQAYKQSLPNLPIVGVKPDKDKRRRVITISRWFEAGRIKIVRDIKNSEALYNQLVNFPSGAHDDLVDALTYIIEHELGGAYGTWDDEEMEGGERVQEPEAVGANDDWGISNAGHKEVKQKDFSFGDLREKDF